MPAPKSTLASKTAELVVALAALAQERQYCADLLARAIDAETRLARGREAWREENAKVHVLEAALAAATVDDVVAA